MPFLRGVSQLTARLVHHSGTMIRFTTSQLTHLPPTDTECRVSLPGSQQVPGHFRCNRANPNVTGPELVRWIKSWVPFAQPVDVAILQQGASNTIRLEVTAPITTTQEWSQLRTALLEEASRIARTRDIRQRRQAYQQWERNPRVRALALRLWGSRCQVVGCNSARTVPDALTAAIVEVHHLDHVSTGGSDSLLNLCLICANHHSLIHRAPSSTLVGQPDERMARLRVDGVELEIRRDAQEFWSNR